MSGGLVMVGLAVLLAELSWTHWAAGLRRQRWRDLLGRPAAQREAAVGLALFCAGMAMSQLSWWEHVLWAILALSFLAVLFRSVARR